MHILGIPGSLRRDSYNRRLLRAAAAEMPPGVEISLFHQLKTLPPYDEDAEGPAEEPSVAAARSAMTAADAILFSTPEYNASLPGQLKNALDWASLPFPDNVLRDKPVAVIGASTGLFGAVWAQAELRKVLSTIGADVLDEELAVGQADEAFDTHGALVSEELRARLADIVKQLVSRTRERVEQHV